MKEEIDMKKIERLDAIEWLANSVKNEIADIADIAIEIMDYLEEGKRGKTFIMEKLQNILSCTNLAEEWAKEAEEKAFELLQEEKGGN